MSDKATPNAHGVRWADSLSGRVAVAVGRRGGEWEVWALYKGTHDLAPYARRFGQDQAAAETYANHVWRTA